MAARIFPIIRVYNIATGELIEERRTELTTKGKLWLGGFIKLQICNGNEVQIFHEMNKEQLEANEAGDDDDNSIS